MVDNISILYNAVVRLVQLKFADESWLTIQCYVMIGDSPDINILTGVRSCKQAFHVDVLTIVMSEEKNWLITKGVSRNVPLYRVKHIIRLRRALTIRIAPILGIVRRFLIFKRI